MSASSEDAASAFPERYYSLQKVLHRLLPGANAARWSLHGNSWSCEQTAFAIPELHFFLDAGFRPHPAYPDYIFLTHQHGDHSTALSAMVSRHKPPTVFLPAELVPRTRAWLESFLMFKLGLDDTSGLLTSYVLLGVQAGQHIPLAGARKGMWVETIACHHSVTSIGYGFYERKQKLRADFAAMTSRQVGELRRQGVAVTEQVDRPLFAYLGDTTADVYASNPALFRYPIIICECTFLHEDLRERAAKTKHTVWPDLEPHVLAHPDVYFVLIHWSRRHTSDEIRAFFEQKRLPNVIPWIAGQNLIEEDPVSADMPSFDHGE